MKLHPSFIPLIFSFLCILQLSSCAAFQPERIGKGAASQIDETIDDLTSEERIKEITKVAVEGAISGLSSEKSDKEISKLGETLSETIGVKLDELFSNLDTRTPGEKFAKGVTDSLITKEVERQVKSFLSGVVKEGGGDVNREIEILTEKINTSIASLLPNLDRQISSLDESLEKVLSEKLKDSLSLFLSHAIGNVELQDFSHKVSTELFSSELRDTLKRMAAEIKREIDPTTNVPSFIEVLRRYAYQFLAIVFFLIAALIYFRFKLKQRVEYERDLVDALDKMMEDDPSLKSNLEKKLSEKNRWTMLQDQLRQKAKNNT